MSIKYQPLFATLISLKNYFLVSAFRWLFIWARNGWLLYSLEPFCPPDKLLMQEEFDPIRKGQGSVRMLLSLTSNVFTDLGLAKMVWAHPSGSGWGRRMSILPEWASQETEGTGSSPLPFQELYKIVIVQHLCRHKLPCFLFLEIKQRALVF